jgi:hypothetical protein
LPGLDLPPALGVPTAVFLETAYSARRAATRGLLVVGKGGVQRTVGLRDDVLQVLLDGRRWPGLATRLSATDDAPLVADRKGRAVSARTVRRWLCAITAAAGDERHKRICSPSDVSRRSRRWAGTSGLPAVSQVDAPNLGGT